MIVLKTNNLSIETSIELYCLGCITGKQESIQIHLFLHQCYIWDVLIWVSKWIIKIQNMLLHFVKLSSPNLLIITIPPSWGSCFLVAFTQSIPITMCHQNKDNYPKVCVSPDLTGIKSLQTLWWSSVSWCGVQLALWETAPWKCLVNEIK